MLVPSMAVVLSAINVPIALAFVIFTISGPFVDRMLSMLTVQASCLLATLSANGSSNQKHAAKRKIDKVNCPAKPSPGISINNGVMNPIKPSTIPMTCLFFIPSSANRGAIR